MYSSEDVDAVEASVEVLPIVVRALGIGATRYLKVTFSMTSDAATRRLNKYQALVPQLTHPLHPAPYRKTNITLQVSSLRALDVVMQECAPRMENWKGTIVEGVAKCWVTLWDGQKTESGALRWELIPSDADLISRE
jgi:hypothetical protein